MTQDASRPRHASMVVSSSMPWELWAICVQLDGGGHGSVDEVCALGVEEAHRAVGIDLDGSAVRYGV